MVPFDFRSSAAAKPRLPRLVSFLMLHCALGVALGIAFAALIVLSNVAGLKDILEASDQPYVPMAMLFAACAFTFGSASMGAAVMSLKDPD